MQVCARSHPVLISFVFIPCWEVEVVCTVQDADAISSQVYLFQAGSASST